MGKKARSTTHRRSTGTKLYAVRDAQGRFKDIQTYKRDTGQDIKRRAKGEEKSTVTAASKEDRLMKLRGSVCCVAGLLILVTGIGIGTAISQQRPPTENKGLEAKSLGMIDLAPEMPAHQLRLRSVLVE